MAVSKSIEARGGILVAHDGSEHAKGALVTAIRFAAALEAPVTVVRAWSLSTAPRPDSWAAGYMPPLDDFEAATLAALNQDVASARADHPGISLTTLVVHGDPAARLIEASGSVDLIVVGRRGRGGFAGLLLGSVSEQVVRHAECSVLVDKRSANSAESIDVEERERLERALTSELKLD